MKKVYLYIQFIEYGFATEYKPLKVFKTKKAAEDFLAEHRWGKVEEIEYVDN